MNHRAWGRVIAALTVVLVALGVWGGCGGATGHTSAMTTDGGGSGGDGAGGGSGSGSGHGGVVACALDGAGCTADVDCCSSSCDPKAHTCLGGSPINCEQAGSACTSALQCCSLACVGGACGATACLSDNAACTSDAQCCGGKCNGTCTPLNTACKTAGNACAANTDCCSQLCVGGQCSLASSFCTQDGDVCTQGPDCCGGTCTIPQGQSLGTCGAPPAGATYCNGGKDGTLCNGCNECCSRLCAPFGPYNINVCQPAEGCHVNGDLCKADSDCCGHAGTGLPGDGNVVCEIQPGFTIGICRNPMGCNPEGDVCHYKNYACGNSSARADCCGALGAKGGACVLDKLGVPRCYGGGACAMTGGACAFDMDCCNGGLCVPGPMGTLVCQPACSPTTGPCTVDADCCSGLHCYVGVGSTSGTCGGAPPPPPGYDAGTPVPGTDAAPPPPPPASDGGPSTCSFYGQSCQQSSDCCNGIPCTTAGGTLCNGAAGCVCVNPTQ